MRSRARMLSLIFALPIIFVATFNAAETKYSLIVVEFNADSHGMARTQTLARYHFNNGVMVKKEDVLTTSEIRLDLSKNQIYGGRYVVTGRGDVIDLTTRTVLFKSDGWLAGIDKKSNRIIIRVEETNEKGIYSFDLASHQYQQIQKQAFPGSMSPDGQFVASGEDMTIRLHRSDGTTTVLGNNFMRSGTAYCNSFMTPSFIWIDDTHLLTMRGNGHLVLVDIEGKAESLVDIPDNDPQGCGPELRRDNGNNIQYADGYKFWRIDLAKKSFEPYLWESEGNGFEMNYPHFDPKGQSIQYHGKGIGQWQRDIFQAASAPGYIAVTSGPLGAHLGGVQDELNIWSEDNGQWTTIKTVWIGSLVGWLKE